MQQRSRAKVFVIAAFLLAAGHFPAAAQEKPSPRSMFERLQQQEDKLRMLEAQFAELRKKFEALSAGQLDTVERRGEAGFRALYTVNRDGSDAKFLVAAPGMISSATPEWSHDGQTVAFDSVETLQSFNESRIFVFGISGPFQGMTRDLGYGNVPSWSPDDRQIAFMLNPSNPANVREGIWTMDADGSNRKWLCRGWYPRWSPDGTEICYHAYFERPQRLHVINVKTGEIRKLFDDTIEVKFGGATWSPDGKQLVFIAQFDGSEHLVTADSNGDRESLSVLYREERKNREMIGPPSWSPDGKQIVLAIQEPDAENRSRRRWSHTYLYTISPEDPQPPKLLEPERVGLINRGMMWSPDGEKIVFSSER